jgi:hypothetical protein
MRRHYYLSIGALTAVVALIAWGAPLITGQTASPSQQTAQPPPKPAVKVGPAPKMPWGNPDLQGTWFVLESVPFERDARSPNKIYLTDAEVAAADAQKGSSPGRNTRADRATADVEGAYNAVFNSILKTSKRTSMIIDPPDGRIPPLTAEGQQRQRGGGGRGAGIGGARGGASVNDNPETTAQSPRCLGVQMPFLPINHTFAQGTVMQIVQGQKSMGIYMEDDHAGGGNRVIHIDGSSHPSLKVKTALGDSRARWEKDTLVVETTNFLQGFRGSNPDTYRMIERFTRVDSHNLRRDITFDDPKTWTRPWTVMIEMGKTDDKRHMIFDSACHEGNYGMTGILIGARTEEGAAKK